MTLMTASPAQSTTLTEEQGTHMTSLTSPSSKGANYGSGVSHSAVPARAAEVTLDDIPSTLHWVRTPYHGFRSVRIYHTISLGGADILTFEVPRHEDEESFIAQVWRYGKGAFGVTIKDEWGIRHEVTEAHCTCRGKAQCAHNIASVDALAVARHWERTQERLAMRPQQRKAAA